MNTWAWWGAELGLQSISRSSRDSRILMAECFVRMAAYGITTLILALFFEQLGISESQTGLFMSLTLIGDVVLSYFVTFYADKLGRRWVLFYSALAMAISGAVFAYSDQYWLLLLAAVIGVISPSGNETGPFKSIEESTLAHLTPYEDRSDIFAWFQMCGTLGSAIGSLGGGILIASFQTKMSVLASYRAVFVVYSIMACVKLILNLFLTSKCEYKEDEENEEEEEEDGESQPLLSNSNSASKHFSSQTIRVLVKLCVLFAIDSIGGGFMPTSWIVVFFNRKFGVSEQQLGSLLFTTTLVGSVTALLSSSIYKRLGPVMAMFVTHFPASVFNMTIPLAKSQNVSMLLLLGRAATTTMDVVPRQVFLSSVVADNERTKVMGIVNVVKTLARSIGPILTGHFAQNGVLYLAFFLGGGFESLHDLGLLVFFGNYNTHSSL